MKLKIILNIIVTILLISCKTSDKINDEKCPRYVSKSIKKIKIEKFKFILNKDSLFFNEVKFYCVNNTSLYTKKVMFDKFGKWSKEIYPDKESHPILLWENLKLFEKDTSHYTIATLGEENIKTVYASFMAFNTEGKDLLADIIYEKKLIAYFEDLIKNNNSEEREFYDIYWKVVMNRNEK